MPLLYTTVAAAVLRSPNRVSDETYEYAFGGNLISSALNQGNVEVVNSTDTFTEGQ